MATLREAVDEFLAQKRIAVRGVSRDTKQPANLIYGTLRNAGYQVFPVNPNAGELEGDPVFPDLHSIPGGVDAVMVVYPARDRQRRRGRECGFGDQKPLAPSIVRQGERVNRSDRARPSEGPARNRGWLSHDVHPRRRHGASLHAVGAECHRRAARAV